MPHVINAYIDGACLNNGRRDAIGGAGLHITGVDYPLPWDSRRRMTSQRAELHGVIMALEKAIETRADIRQSTPLLLRIHTDSSYAVNCFTEWIKKWKNNGWLNSQRLAVANQDLLEEGDDLIRTIRRGGQDQVVFVKIAREDNVIADRLARQACYE